MLELMQSYVGTSEHLIDQLTAALQSAYIGFKEKSDRLTDTS